MLDEFVMQQLSHLADEDSEYFEKLLNQKASDFFSSSQNEKELSDLRKKKAQLEAAIANQVKNLREDEIEYTCADSDARDGDCVIY